VVIDRLALVLYVFGWGIKLLVFAIIIVGPLNRFFGRR